MFDQVFISHAKEDQKVAEELHDYLTRNGYSPWLDKKDLKVGQNWDYEINKALKESTFVVLLLSSTSVQKRGYVQKEFNLAVEYSKNMLIDDIYIIPILLDDCKIPDHLNRFQWIGIGNENSMVAILESLDLQRKKYLESLSSEQRGINDYTTFSIDLGISIPTETDYSCDLPLFYKNRFFDSNFVNTYIQQKVLGKINEYRKWTNEPDDYFSLETENSFSLDISHSIIRLDEYFLSLSIDYFSYFGGAHPNNNTDTLNFAFKPERSLRIDDIIEYEYDCMQAFIHKSLQKFGTEDQKRCLGGYVQYLSEGNLDFTFDEKTLQIDFTNHIPRVILALGCLKIPFDKLPSKTIKLDQVKNVFGD